MLSAASRSHAFLCSCHKSDCTTAGLRELRPREPAASNPPENLRHGSFGSFGACEGVAVRRDQRVLTRPQLNDRSLLKEAQTYVNGQWVGAKSGKTFEVYGKHRALCAASWLETLPADINSLQTRPPASS